MVKNIILLLLTGFAFGQIKTTKGILQDKTNTSKPYDSLANFLGEDVYKYVGQELYLMGKFESLRHYGYRDFYTSLIDLGKPYKNIYKPSDKPSNYSSKYEDLAEKYFEVLDVTKNIYESKWMDMRRENYYFLKLKEKSSGDIVYYLYNSKYEFPFVAVGFFEKLKKNYIGKKFVFKEYFFKNMGKNHLNLNTGKPIIYQLGDNWECVDIIIDENIYKLSLVLKDRIGQKIISEYDYFYPKKYSFVFTAGEVQRYKQKFGIENLKAILQGKVKIGMTKEMCKLSWGKPEDINTTNKSTRKTEQWVYDNSYLYFTNGVLTTIQN